MEMGHFHVPKVPLIRHKVPIGVWKNASETCTSFKRVEKQRDLPKLYIINEMSWVFFYLHNNNHLEKILRI